MRKAFRYIVLGLGGLGSAAAYWLAREAGADVLGLEQFEFGHVRGGSHDHSRIIRLSYHTPHYVHLARAAYGAWSIVETESGETLVTRTGGLDLFPAGGAIPLGDYTRSLDAEQVPFELMTAGEAMRHWPQFKLNEEVQVLFQQDSGVVAANRGTATHRRLARQHGATLLDRRPITAIRDRNGQVEIDAGGEIFTAEQVVITAGAWTNTLLAHLGQRLPLVVTQEQLTYFKAERLSLFTPDRFPIWIWMDEPCFYGFPMYGEPGVKAAQDVGGREVTAETRTFEPDPAAQHRLTQFMNRMLPDAGSDVLYTKTCLYTLTPDRDFVIDQVPGHPAVWLLTDGAHGFKFASWFGRTVAELMLTGSTRHDLSPFRYDRPILQLADPPRSYMV